MQVNSTRHTAFSHPYMPRCNATSKCELARPKGGPAWFTSPAGAGMRGFRAGRPRANYSQELVVRAGQGPDDHAFYRIRRPNPTPIANHHVVRHPAGLTGAVVRAEPDDGPRQV